MKITAKTSRIVTGSTWKCPLIISTLLFRQVGPTDAGPLPEKTVLEAELAKADLNQNEARTAFENPMYERSEISAPHAVVTLDGATRGDSEDPHGKGKK